MNLFNKKMIIIVAILFVGLNEIEAADPPKWTYPSDNYLWRQEGNVSGADKYKACALDKKQSPIDLPSFTEVGVRKESLNIKFNNKTQLGGFDSGHALEWSSSGKKQTNQTATKLITLKLDNKTYELHQLHIHTVSEHTVGGKHADLEIHFVAEDSNKGGEDAVISVLCKRNKTASGSETAFFDDLKTHFNTENDNTGKLTPKTGTVDVNDLFKNLDKKKYIRYTGSFTTPPCTKNVQWVVMATYCDAPETFFTEFTRKHDVMSNNFRFRQPLGKRKIDYNPNDSGSSTLSVMSVALATIIVLLY